MPLLHAQTKNEKANIKYNKVLSDLTGKPTIDSNKQVLKVEGLKYKKHFFSVAGITSIAFVKPIQMTFGVALSGGYRIFLNQN
ncbi:MAG: hypothetical protein IPF58_02600 [Saprospirales bacterium]|nr:hypothetical protein [Saprospirales bacterium]